VRPKTKTYNVEKSVWKANSKNRESTYRSNEAVHE